MEDMISVEPFQFNASVQHHFHLGHQVNTNSCLLVLLLYFLCQNRHCLQSFGRDSLNQNPLIFFLRVYCWIFSLQMETVSKQEYMRILSELDLLMTKFVALEQENQNFLVACSKWVLKRHKNMRNSLNVSNNLKQLCYLFNNKVQPLKGCLRNPNLVFPQSLMV